MFCQDMNKIILIGVRREGRHVQNTSHSIDGWCISHVSFLAFVSVNPLEFSALRALSELIEDVLLVTGPDSGFGTS